MEEYEASWKSSDGLELYTQGWQPDGDEKTVVVLVHGSADRLPGMPH